MVDCSSDDARACAEALDALHEYLDGELAPDRLARIGEHLDACRRCGLEAEAYRALKQAVREAGNGVGEPVLERLRAYARRLGSTQCSHTGESITLEISGLRYVERA